MKKIAEPVTRSNIEALTGDGAVAATREFRDDDAGYLAWRANHLDGYVINIGRAYSPNTARVHRAGCRTITGKNPHAGPWTGPYVKVCGNDLTELARWAMHRFGKQVPPCGTCHPAAVAMQQVAREPVGPMTTPPGRESCYELREPNADNTSIEAWADDYIRFERRPDWQEHLRTEIRNRCQYLEPSPEQILHATFFGAKLPNSDVENLALYNIGSFKVAGRNGIRFEHGSGVPPAPGLGKYRFGYRYALEPRLGTFIHWEQTRSLVSFDWTDLGAFAGDKQLAQVWLALSRCKAAVFEPSAPNTPFAVRIQVRPPAGHQPVWGGLVKGIFDGVICAFHCQTDTTDLQEVVTRLAAVLPADPEEIEEHLLDGRTAVLGAKGRLVSPYRVGVKWNPSDHLCVAGELLAAEPAGPRWAIKGELVELAR